MLRQPGRDAGGEAAGALALRRPGKSGFGADASCIVLETGRGWGEGLRGHKAFLSLMILHLSEGPHRDTAGRVAGLVEAEEQL